MLEVYSRQRYPHPLTLRDGATLQIRPLQDQDCDLLSRFYEAIPARELNQLDRNPRSGELMREWVEGAHRGEMLHLLALEESTAEIVAHCVVYQTLRGWKAHQGRIRVITRPDFRRRGLASKMIQEMIQVSLNSGLDLLVAEFMMEQGPAMEAFSRNGFHRTALIPQYVRDLEGRDHDLVLMARNIREQEYFAGD